MRKALAMASGLLALTCLLTVVCLIAFSKTEAAAPLSVLAPPASTVDTTKLHFPERYLPQASQAVFMLKPYDSQRERGSSGGTGFLVQTDLGVTVILTNSHICSMSEDSGQYPFLIAQQGNQVFAVRVLNQSKHTDLCIVAAPPDITASRTPFRLSSRNLQPGDQVAVYGHPFLRPLTMSYGSYTNTSREPIGQDFEFAPDRIFAMSRVDFMVMPGNSGSPVVDTNGLVVGVVFAMEGPNKIGLFVPLDEVKHFLSTGE